MKRTPQGRNRDAKTSFNQKDREYAIYAAKGSSDDAVTASNQYTNEQISNVHQVPPGGTTGQALTKASNTDFDTTWSTVGGGGGGGDVTGPGSSTNNHIAQFDGTTGKVIKDGGLSSASFDAAGAATTAQTNAEAYADSLATNYDAAGDAAAAEVAAKAYADSLASNYDPAGAASTAQTAAEAFATAADATVLSTAEGYADTGDATTLSTAEAYTDAAIAGLPAVPVDLDDLADVDAPTPADGQVLTWVNADGAWEAVDPTGGGGSTPTVPGLAKIISAWPVDLSHDGIAAGGAVIEVPPAIDQLIDRNVIDMLHGGRGSSQSSPSAGLNPLVLSFIGF